MAAGDLLTRGTVWLALLLYVAALSLRLSTRERAARIYWTAGCVCFLAHVLCAFGFVHHWSHTAAFDATARRTAEMTGVYSGGGLYANYAFAAVWIADTVFAWLAGTRCYRARPKWVAWSVQGFMAFMWINATLVFGAGAIRWVGAAAAAFLAWRIARLRNA